MGGVLELGEQAAIKKEREREIFGKLLCLRSILREKFTERAET